MIVDQTRRGLLAILASGVAPMVFRSGIGSGVLMPVQPRIVGLWDYDLIESSKRLWPIATSLRRIDFAKVRSIESMTLELLASELDRAIWLPGVPMFGSESEP